MRKGIRIISLILIGIMLFSLAIPTFSFADSPFKDKGNSSGNYSFRQGPPGLLMVRLLTDYTPFDGNKIKFNKKNIKFDLPPVIKGGRTLIPVRAFTEGMGAKVEWTDPIVTITAENSDGDEVVIEFNLEDGTVEVNGKEVDIDVRPGIINNRTFVPLRFIAEILGCKVSHNPPYGWIDIDQGPVLRPASVTFKDEDDIKDVDVRLILNDYEFKGIEGLDEGTGSGDEYTYDEDDKIVTIDKDYIESLDDEKTVLTFKFEDSDDDDKEVERSFRIFLEFNAEDNEPSLDPTKVTFEEKVDIEDVEVTLDLNGYTFKGIQGLTRNEDYERDGNEVTILEEYIEDLDNEVTTLKFLFEKDGDTVKEDFKITLEFNDEDNEPSIDPTKVTFEDAVDVEDVEVTLDLNGWTFKGIQGLVRNEDYEQDGNEVTILEEYINDLDDEVTTLKFLFEKDGDTVKEDFKITLEFNDEDVNPDITPARVRFTSVSAVKDTVVTLTLDGWTFEGIMNGDDELERGEDKDYQVSGSKVTLDDNYLRELDDEVTELNFIFEKGSDDVELEFEVEIEGL